MIDKYYFYRALNINKTNQLLVALERGQAVQKIKF